jgi:hypothetical protein
MNLFRSDKYTEIRWSDGIQPTLIITLGLLLTSVRIWFVFIEHNAVVVANGGD